MGGAWTYGPGPGGGGTGQLSRPYVSRRGVLEGDGAASEGGMGIPRAVAWRWQTADRFAVAGKGHGQRRGMTRQPVQYCVEL
jgi:hypothetical protein